MIFQTKLPDFLTRITQLKTPLHKHTLLNHDFLMEHENNLHMYYAPHNESININAKVIIVGITPGWSQMKTAYESLVQSISKNEDLSEMLRKAKVAAGFSGQIRTNLISMLDQIGLPDFPALSASEQLFSTKRDLLHTTSVIRYPVFVNGKNYTGYSPSIDQSRLLSRFAYHIFPQELEQVHSSALIIPLGKAVEKVVYNIKLQNSLDHHTFLFGFPHPSGANGHRIQQLKQNQKILQQKVSDWVSNEYL